MDKEKNQIKNQLYSTTGTKFKSFITKIHAIFFLVRYE